MPSGFLLKQNWPSTCWNGPGYAPWRVSPMRNPGHGPIPGRWRYLKCPVLANASSSWKEVPAETFSLPIETIDSYIDTSYTDLEGAVELAAAAFPADTRKKIVLITDGNENKGDLLQGIRFASGNEIAVDVLPVSYEHKEEVIPSHKS